MVKKTLQIHSENILPIIKRWLYSDKDIFVRELVSNSCDAIHKIKILCDQGKAACKDEEQRIDVRIDKERGTLTFSDTGIGMDADEVERYIAQIAFSSAEEFVERYKGESEKDQMIGHFGLGFYSAYMVAEKVEINTLSYKEGAEPVFWSCGTTTEYEMGKGSREERGTTITLFLGKEEKEYLEVARLREILRHYCLFLPYPVYLEGERVNPKEPLWIKGPADCKDEEYLDFYQTLYPFQEEPLFWVHLNVDYPFHLKGILYFPKLRRDQDLEKSTVKLYCNRVFVSDNCKDVIPNYLMVLQGVIDSPDIPLNVSRSHLQMDRTVRQLAGHISKKVADSLATLFRTNRKRFEERWPHIAPILKLGALEDQHFYDRIKDLLIFKVVGGEWTTIANYLERNGEKTANKVFYTRDEEHLSHVSELFSKKGIEVIVADQPIDAYLLSFLEGKMAPVTFRRVDGGLEELLLDKEREKTILDAEGKTEASRLADFVQKQLGREDVTVEAKSLASDGLPAFVVVDEETRRMRDHLMAFDPGKAGTVPFGKQTFVVNTNSPLISALQKLGKGDHALAGEVVQALFDLSLLSQREMAPSALNGFIARNTAVLEKLINRAVKE